MKKIVYQFIRPFQLGLLYLSYTLFKLKKVESTFGWVIGVDEIANNIKNLSKVLTPSVCVCLDLNKFYLNNKYDYFISINNKYLKFFYRIIYGPLLLGYLSNKHSHFWYLWSTGFLNNRNDELKFLKSKNKTIACMFVGDDIRSPSLLKEYADDRQEDTFINYYPEFFLSKEYEKEKMIIAEGADSYADIIFTHKMCQMSYLQRQVYSWTYFCNDEYFNKNIDKFINKIKIVHAPSNPIGKGTPLVRAAIKKLELQGYDFEYVELQNIPNEMVIEHLKTAHILLNQFYSYTSGLLGAEGMANYCAVLQSADPNIEKGIPQDSEDAWLVTKYWELYDNLRFLLDNPDRIKFYANNGYEFALKYYSYEGGGKYMNNILKENNII